MHIVKVLSCYTVVAAADRTRSGCNCEPGACLQLDFVCLPQACGRNTRQFNSPAPEHQAFHSTWAHGLTKSRADAGASARSSSVSPHRLTALHI